MQRPPLPGNQTTRRIITAAHNSELFSDAQLKLSALDMLL